MKEAEEARLIRESLEGRRGAFGALIERYQASLFNGVFRLVHDYDDAQDITQTVFLKSFENLRQFDFHHKFYSWIYRIAINESLNFLKRNNRLEPIDEHRQQTDRTPEDELVGNELDRTVQQSLMTLPADYRTVIVLKHFADCSYRDIASILEIPEKTVKSRLFTARRMLRVRLARTTLIKTQDP